MQDQSLSILPGALCDGREGQKVHVPASFLYDTRVPSTETPRLLDWLRSMSSDGKRLESVSNESITTFLNLRALSVLQEIQLLDEGEEGIGCGLYFAKQDTFIRMPLFFNDTLALEDQLKEIASEGGGSLSNYVLLREEVGNLQVGLLMKRVVIRVQVSRKDDGKFQTHTGALIVRSPDSEEIQSPEFLFTMQDNESSQPPDATKSDKSGQELVTDEEGRECTIEIRKIINQWHDDAFNRLESTSNGNLKVHAFDKLYWNPHNPFSNKLHAIGSYDSDGKTEIISYANNSGENWMKAYTTKEWTHLIKQTAREAVNLLDRDLEERSKKMGLQTPLRLSMASVDLELETNWFGQLETCWVVSLRPVVFG